MISNFFYKIINDNKELVFLKAKRTINYKIKEMENWKPMKINWEISNHLKKFQK